RLPRRRSKRNPTNLLYFNFFPKLSAGQNFSNWTKFLKFFSFFFVQISTMSGFNLANMTTTDKAAVLAEELINSGTKVMDAISTAAQTYEVTVESVRNAYYRKRGTPAKTHGNRALTDEQEELLRTVISVLSTHNFPVGPHSIPNMVKEFFEIEISVKTAKRFISRHRDCLKVRKGKLLSKKRTGSEVLVDCASFVEEVKDVARRFPLLAENVINYDETRVFVQLGPDNIIHDVRRERPQVSGQKGGTIGTLIQFVLASGLPLMGVWVFHGKENNDSGFMQINVPLPEEVPCAYGSPLFMVSATETSYSNGRLHASIMKQFFDFWKNFHPGAHCHVFGDQLSFHNDIQLVKEGLRDNILLWRLPKNASHFLQPLDSTCFANFKKTICDLEKKNPLPWSTVT
ncbi:MAG: hypothetical protein IJZ20_00555, partial [Clostridia bacterium]|nr:hypothetical protein [Clostridia bacterium]